MGEALTTLRHALHPFSTKVAGGIAEVLVKICGEKPRTKQHTKWGLQHMRRMSHDHIVPKN